MPAASSDAMVYEGGNTFVEAAPAQADCGCGNGVVVESGDMSYTSGDVVTFPATEGVPVTEGAVIESAPAMESAPAVDGNVIEGVIESPASEVPAAPVGDTSSYLGAPALNQGEWVVEGSDKVVETAETEASSEGVQATPVSTGEVIYDSAPAAPAEAPAVEAATDAVPGAPAEDKAAE